MLTGCITKALTRAHSLGAMQLNHINYLKPIIGHGIDFRAYGSYFYHQIRLGYFLTKLNLNETTLIELNAFKDDSRKPISSLVQSGRRFYNLNDALSKF